MRLALVAGAVAHGDDHVVARVVGRRDGDRRVLPRAVHRRAVEPHGHADAQQPVVSRLSPSALPASHVVVAHELDDPVEAGAVVARVVGDPGGGGVREGVAVDEVAAAQLYRVDVQLGCGEIEEPLHQSAGLRSPGTAVRPDLARVGGGRSVGAVDGRNAVRATEHERRRVGDQRAEHGVATGVARDVGLEADDDAVGA